MEGDGDLLGGALDRLQVLGGEVDSTGGRVVGDGLVLHGQSGLEVAAGKAGRSQVGLGR